MPFDMSNEGKRNPSFQPWPKDKVSPLDLFEIIQVIGERWHQFLPQIEHFRDDDDYLDQVIALHDKNKNYGQSTQADLRNFLHHLDYLVELVDGVEQLSRTKHDNKWFKPFTQELALISGDYPYYLQNLLQREGSDEAPDISLTLVSKRDFLNWTKDRLQDSCNAVAPPIPLAEQFEIIDKISKILDISPNRER